MKIGLDKFMTHVAYIYIVFPFFLFCVFWLRWYYGLTMSVVLFSSYIYSIKSTSFIEIVQLKKHFPKILVSLAVILIVVFFSGIGNFSYQVEDHSFRNAIYHDLISHKWPLFMNEKGNVPFLDGPRLYIYYIEYWFPPALLAKFFGVRTANVFLYLWTVLGITLIFYFLCRFLRNFELKILFIFLFFNSLYLLVSAFKFPLTGLLTDDYHLWSGNMVLAGSCLDSTYWIYNQTIGPWLIITMILGNISRKNIFFLYALCYMHGPFAFIGFFPFLLIIVAKRMFSKQELAKKLADRIQPYISFQNLVAAPLIVTITYLYLSASSTVQSIYFTHVSLRKYLVFISISFGIISLLIFHKYKKEPFLYAALFAMLVLPLIGMGDIQPMTFCARVSLAPMFVLMVLVAKYIVEEENTLVKKLVVAYLIVGGIEPFLIFGRSVVFTVGYHINPAGMNSYLLTRTTTYNDRINMLPKSNDLKSQNYLLLNNIETEDTSVNNRLKLYKNESSNTPFSKYLLKVDHPK